MKVIWEIDADGCDTPEEAARFAWKQMRAKGSTANVFDVITDDGLQTRVDLQEVIEEDNPAPAQQTPCDAKDRTEAEIEADKITRLLAAEEFGSDEIEIYDNAPVSRCEDGAAWVQAWLYVHPDADKREGGVA